MTCAVRTTGATVHFSFSACALVALMLALPVQGVETVGKNERPKVTFERDIRPILKAHCFQCHGEEGHREGNLDLRLRRFLVTGGEGGPSIEPGKPDESYLVERLRNKEMPPGKDTPKLSAKQLDTIERWIAAGAPTARAEPADPKDLPAVTEEEREHWAFQKLARPEVAKPQASERVRNEIDAFLLARLEKEGLTFSLDADRRTLIRRATIDLHGLPPTPEEVDAFVNDPAADAYERLIDRLLDSPRYGERWGRHWLDVAGYADSEGYNEADVVRDDAWRYRDYVIRAFNADKPFDLFIQEQLAGDELLALESRSKVQGVQSPKSKNGKPTLDFGPWPLDSSTARDKLTATGFLRMAPDGTGTKDDNNEVARNAVVAETVKIVSSALYGLTVGCAQCHDHRYDPIPQKDYYRLRAVFEPAFDVPKWKRPEQRRVSLMTDADRAEVKRLEKQAKLIEDEFKPIFIKYRDIALASELEKVSPEVREAGLAWQRGPDTVTAEQQALLKQNPSIALPVEFRTERDFAKVREVLLRIDGSKHNHGLRVVFVDAFKEIKDRAEAIRAQKPKNEGIRALTEQFAGDPPPTHVFLRGDPAHPGETVGPGDLSVLSNEQACDVPLDDPELPSTGRRLAFARKLTAGEHPLVARVLVNRFWLHHMGRGLVATPGDFGTQGEAPSHPELLDWLAMWFVDGGQSSEDSGQKSEIRSQTSETNAPASGVASARRSPASRSPLAHSPPLQDSHSPPLQGGAGGVAPSEIDTPSQPATAGAAWSLKAFHRLLMTSTAYRQSSDRHDRGDAVDADNRLYWRMPIRRLEAEAVRDAILATSGNLNLEAFGPPVPVGDDADGQAIVGVEELAGGKKTIRIDDGSEFRRSVYVQVRRSVPAYILDAFDSPELDPNCEVRRSSTVAQQSLVLMNSGFIIDEAGRFADRLVREAGALPADRLRLAWRLAFAAEPTAAELQGMTRFLERQTEQFQKATAEMTDQESAEKRDAERLALSSLCQVLLSSNRFLYVE